MHTVFVETRGLVKMAGTVRRMPTRAHTGRSRNDEARTAILTAAAELLAEQDSVSITVAAIAARAGAGKQTLYRWWPSKGAVLLDAMVMTAEAEVPARSSGNLRADLNRFVGATFIAAAKHRGLLIGVLREALGDAETATQLDGFITTRREALRQILCAAHRAGEPINPDVFETVIDQLFGFLWYTLIFGTASLDRAQARRLVDGLMTQLAAQA
jgi:AcrR family transcriptional regulator